MPQDLPGHAAVGERLRRRRIDVLNKGLREMARTLGIAPAYLTDIERDHRAPSEALLVRVAQHYGIDEAELRTAWNKAARIVDEIATQDSTTARNVPELLRRARGLSSEQWDCLIEEARRMASAAHLEK